MLKDRRDAASDAGPIRGAVAVLCAQPRFSRLLRLSLEGDERQVVEWDHQQGPPDPHAAVVVVDLDSLGLHAPGALDLLAGWGVDDATPVLFISVYPFDAPALHRAGPYDALQPPFSPIVLGNRVLELLQRSTSKPATASGPDTGNARSILGGCCDAAANR
jgi:hypothetical protein